MAWAAEVVDSLENTGLFITYSGVARKAWADEGVCGFGRLESVHGGQEIQLSGVEGVQTPCTDVRRRIV